jgi:hypothetical protein
MVGHVRLRAVANGALRSPRASRKAAVPFHQSIERKSAMISQRSALAGSAGVALLLALACRDAPTSTVAPAFSPDVALDSTDELPPEPSIINPYTELRFTRFADRSLLEIRAGMEYMGNRAWMSTRYDVRGEGVSQSDAFENQKDDTFNPAIWKRFDQTYYVELPRSCGLEISAFTQHRAWWAVYVRFWPNWESRRAITSSRAADLHLPACEKEEETTTTTGGGGSYITVTTCWYWATIVNGRVTAVELDYCDSVVIPIDENSAVNQM